MKPELLLPVGTTESFYAAIEGGAEAVYLGLRKFNARGRAANFTINQLQSILKESEKKKIKVFFTLNTLIKNSELPELLDTLFILSQTTISAIIIQDWGVFYLIKKYFPKLKIHASTQMKTHNSICADYLYEKEFERIIMARELTFSELKKISRKTGIELEIFAHGALCYSFSGVCLFSSFLGGMSANRGLCRQPCRRIYHSSEKSGYFFSLKDLQLIEILPEIMKLNIKAIKIEGRMRSAEYVYQVARAYRMVIDDPNRIEEAKEILKFDFGREKTSYFFGNNISKAIAENPYTGIFIGEIINSSDDKFSFKTLHPLQIRNRIRILPKSGADSKIIKIKGFLLEKEEGKKEKLDIGERVTIKTENNFQRGDKVFLIGLAEKRFKNRFTLEGKRVKLHFPEQKRENILGKIGSKQILNYEQLFVRINSLRWLRKIFFDKIDFLILNLTKQECQEIDLRNPFLKRNIHKLIIELPKFISEDDIEFYQKMCKSFYRIGITNFMLSHISQKKIISFFKKAKIYTNENVYIFNDSSIQFLKEEKIWSYVYPLENDFQNLTFGKDRKGIVPLFFVPELFYSRMPVFLNHQDTPIRSYFPTGQATAQSFKDRDFNYQKIVRDGITVIVPEIPVSVLQHKNKLFKAGFRRFLIDFSHLNPSQKTFNRILKKYQTSSPEYPGTIFNFKDGLR
ncbi:MAG: U32 family peptidase [Armatimonadetes bacterium]|nr:U32 family peptidase [Armatimonadota bacterium]